jgi:hypothetical protein
MLTGFLVLADCSSRPENSPIPPQTVSMNSRTLAEFQTQVEQYLELRKKIVAEIPPVSEKSTAEELSAHQQALTAAIIAYRQGEKRGNMFSPEVDAAIRRILTREFSGPDGSAVIDGVKQGNPNMEGNPVQQAPTQEVKPMVTLAVNGVYNSAAPSSSVPPSLLLNLPLLPEQVRYRFVGRALILRDTEANVILDFIPDVVPDPTIPR